MVKELNENNFMEEIKEKKVLVDFWASWCGPCRALGPIMEEVAESGITVYKVNVDDNPELAKEYGIMSIPCVIAFDNGEEINRSIGLKSKSEIMDMIK